MTTFEVGPAEFKVGEATIRIGSPDSAEAKEVRAQFAENDANDRKLQAIRADALREHYEEFVIVTDWGRKVRYYPTWEAFAAAISAEESGAAADDYLVEWPEPLILVA